jgi:two-component system sensor histidine kinase BaeS
MHMTTAQFPLSGASSPAQRALLVRLWGSAALIAASSASIIWEANPGINWLLCVAVASAALLGAAHAEGTVRHVAPPLVLAMMPAVGIVSAASPLLHGLSILMVLSLLAIAIARTHPARYARVRTAELVALPVIVFVTCVVEATRRATETVRELTNDRAVPLIRGLVLTLPIAGLFALLLSSVDPTLSTWRDEVERLLSSWGFLPRLVFFGVVLGLSLGALGYALSPAEKESRPTAERKPILQLGETERLMVMSTIAGLFTLFLTLQLSYLFGDVARAQGSGVSYAEWVHRGFAELTIVATLCGGVMLWLALSAPATMRRRRILIVELIVLGETQVLLHSAFRRVLLYEGAYGFTTTRLYAQAYMIVVAASLLLLAHELLRQPSARRLLGRAGALAVMGMAGVSVWNHEAWIVRQNVARQAETGQLDMRYLACDLSARAVPEVLRAVRGVDVGTAGLAREAIGERFVGKLNDSWYEWNAGRSRARRAIATSGIVAPRADRSGSACRREWS